MSGNVVKCKKGYIRVVWDNLFVNAAGSFPLSCRTIGIFQGSALLAPLSGKGKDKIPTFHL